MIVHWRSLEHNIWTTAYRSLFDWGMVMAWLILLAGLGLAVVLGN